MDTKTEKPKILSAKTELKNVQNRKTEKPNASLLDSKQSQSVIGQRQAGNVNVKFPGDLWGRWRQAANAEASSEDTMLLN